MLAIVAINFAGLTGLFFLVYLTVDLEQNKPDFFNGTLGNTTDVLGNVEKHLYIQ